jgi:hypothetical protein
LLEVAVALLLLLAVVVLVDIEQVIHPALEFQRPKVLVAVGLLNLL